MGCDTGVSEKLFGCEPNIQHFNHPAGNSGRCGGLMAQTFGPLDGRLNISCCARSYLLHLESVIVL